MDLRNGPSHVFNDHTNCSPSFCKVKAQITPSNPVPTTSTENAENDDMLGDIIEQETEEERLMHEEEDEARGGDMSINRKNIPDYLFFRVQRAGDRLVSIAPQLVTNTTTNLAECYMNIRCKFDGGKFYNRIQRGAFQHRSYGAGLRFQLGPDWSSQVWPRATGSEPGEVMVDLNAKRKREHEKSADCKSKPEYKEQRKRAK